jgi:hypothetical protein
MELSQLLALGITISPLILYGFGWGVGIWGFGGEGNPL